MSGGRWARFKAALAHAFADTGGEHALDAGDHALLERTAAAIRRRGLTDAALMAAAAAGPLAFLGSQALIAARPVLTAGGVRAMIGALVGTALEPGDLDRVQRLLENRAAVDVLLSKLEEPDAD